MNANAIKVYELIKQAHKFLADAEVQMDNHEGINARYDLSEASNIIDDAMGLIDELMAPEPTREEYESRWDK